MAHRKIKLLIVYSSDHEDSLGWANYIEEKMTDVDVKTKCIDIETKLSSERLQPVAVLFIVTEQLIERMKVPSDPFMETLSKMVHCPKCVCLVQIQKDDLETQSCTVNYVKSHLQHLQNLQVDKWRMICYPDSTTLDEVIFALECESTAEVPKVPAPLPKPKRVPLPKPKPPPKLPPDPSPAKTPPNIAVRKSAVVINTEVTAGEYVVVRGSEADQEELRARLMSVSCDGPRPTFNDTNVVLRQTSCLGDGDVQGLGHFYNFLVPATIVLESGDYALQVVTKTGDRIGNCSRTQFHLYSLKNTAKSLMLKMAEPMQLIFKPVPGFTHQQLDEIVTEHFRSVFTLRSLNVTWINLWHEKKESATRPGDSYTPSLLHFAAYYGLREMCGFLLDVPCVTALCTLQDLNGCNCRDLAARRNYPELADFIEQSVTVYETYQNIEIYMERHRALLMSYVKENYSSMGGADEIQFPFVKRETDQEVCSVLYVTMERQSFEETCACFKTEPNQALYSDLDQTYFPADDIQTYLMQKPPRRPGTEELCYKRDFLKYRTRSDESRRENFDQKQRLQEELYSVIPPRVRDMMKSGDKFMPAEDDEEGYEFPENSCGS